MRPDKQQVQECDAATQPILKELRLCVGRAGRTFS
jgi:hypothetical protein